jgi:hypothetical protein
MMSRMRCVDFTVHVDIRISPVVSIRVQISKVQFINFFFLLIYHVAAFNDIEAFNEDYIVSWLVLQKNLYYQSCLLSQALIHRYKTGSLERRGSGW